MSILKNRLTLCLLILIHLAVFPASFSNHALAANNTTEISDPLEGVNRAIYKFNNVVDRALLTPLAKGYRFIFPEFSRKGVRNALRNLTEPVTFINAVLQGDLEHSAVTFWRFTVNSTIGLAGFMEIVENEGLRHRKEDFGQTLGRYGVGFGPYIVLPIIGPSSTRDLVGTAVDAVSDPFTYAFDEAGNAVRSGVQGVDAREATLDITDEINRVSLDPYATIRSLYTQRRLDEINNGTTKKRIKK